VTPEAKNQFTAALESALAGLHSGLVSVDNAAAVADSVSAAHAEALMTAWQLSIYHCALQFIGRKKVSHDGSCKSWYTAQLQQWRTSVDRLRDAVIKARNGSSHVSAEELARLMQAYEAMRKQYKKAVRKQKAMDDERLNNELLDAARRGDSKCFFAILKRRRGYYRLNTAPITVADKHGNIKSGKEAAQVWADLYEAIGNDRDDEKSEQGVAQLDAAFKKEVEQKLAKLVSEHASMPGMDADFSVKELDTALGRLKQNVAAGPDLIPNSFLALMGPTAKATLLMLFNTIWRSGTWPDGWRQGTVMPLFKQGSGSKRTDANDYRPITLTSCVSKLFEALLLSRLNDWSQRTARLVEEQCGFRAGRSTLDQIFTLHELLAHKREAGKVTYMAFLDARRAYDTVWREGLLFKLAQAGIRGRMFSMLHSMLARTSRRVVIDGFVSSDFMTSVGLPQGAVLSPLLYALFINGLAEQLKNEGLGLQFYDRIVGILLYADDIVLLAETPEQLQRMLDIASQYASQWQFKFNTKPGKSNVVICPHSAHERYTNFFKLSGAPLAVTEQYKYLGLEMGQIDRDCWQTYRARVLSKTEYASMQLRYSIRGRRTLPLLTAVQIFKTLVRPVLEYADSIWGAMTTQKALKLLEDVQLRFGRELLRFPRTSSSEFVLRELGLQSMAERVQLACFKLYGKLCMMPQDRLPAYVFHKRCEEVDRGKAKHSWCRQMLKRLKGADEIETWRRRTVTPDWNVRIKRKIRAMFKFKSDAKLKDQSTMTLFRQLGPASKNGLLKSSLHHPGALIRVKLRSVALPLMCIVGRQNGLERHQCRCRLCGSQEIENAEHFACRCSFFDDLRRECQRRLRAAFGAELTSNLQQAIDKFDVNLMLGDKWQKNLSSKTREDADTVICCYFKKAWARRQQEWKNFTQEDNAWKLK
jgi:hypothetical protein